MSARKTLPAALLVALWLGACTGGPAIDYLRAEYGSAEPDGIVDFEEGQSSGLQVFQIWIHKTKPKINVQTGLRTAGESGFVKGATYGMASTAPVQPSFERAAYKFFEDRGQVGCKISNANRIHELVYEFDYECGVPSQSAQKAKVKRR